MPCVNCKLCGSNFYAKPNWIKKGYGKYCSAQCQHESLKNGKVVKCFICSKPTYKTQKALKKSKSKKYFCSKRCQTIWRNSIVYVGKNHFNWKGGESIYRDILVRSKKIQACKRCEINDSRVLSVHHLDRNKKNNKIDNLIWLCHNCHHLIHHDIKENRKFMEILV